MRVRISITLVMSAGCWCGKTFCSPVPRTRKSRRCWEEIEAEARENVARLAQHPS
jgi:hypothetical protein